MRYKTRIIYSVITIGVLLAGFLLPRQILHMQDQRQAARVDRYELNSITLNVTSPLFEKLSAVKAGIIVEVGSQVDTRMSEEEAQEQMFVVNEMFGVIGVVDMETLQTPIITQRLVIDEEKGNSFIIWQGHLEDDFCGIDVLIDDETGKMLGMTTYVYYSSKGYNLEALKELLKNYYELADVIYTEKNYVNVAEQTDVDVVNPEDMDGIIVDIYGNVSTANGFETALVFQLVNEAGEYYDYVLYMREGDIFSLNQI